ncbi:MAG: putative heat shock protein [Streblomastix strix]|uniref:Putative heat shock protein n=1 Tax=Streblomastix strix TaxID=222440 RepID=A0A5J4WCL4_9EUKA|nr:MAG: putative heat shock protein [Streblomastix strix]
MSRNELFLQSRLNLRQQAKRVNVWARSPSPPSAYLRKLEQKNPSPPRKDERIEEQEQINKSRHQTEQRSKSISSQEESSNSNQSDESEESQTNEESSSSSSQSSEIITNIPHKRHRKDHHHKQRKHQMKKDKKKHKKEKIEEKENSDSRESKINKNINQLDESEGKRERNMPSSSEDDVDKIQQDEDKDMDKVTIEGPGLYMEGIEDDAELGPQPAPHLPFDDGKTDYGGALLAGEGEAMAAFVQQNKRIPRRGEIGMTPEQIEHFEKVGFVMSGSRHKRMNAVRIRKENQVYSAEEKKQLAQYEYDQKVARENRLNAQLLENVQMQMQDAKMKLEKEKEKEKESHKMDKVTERKRK